MKVLWKKTIEEQIWYGHKTEKALSEPYLHYSKLPFNEVYEDEDFDSVYAYLENHGIAARNGIALLSHLPIIVFHPPFSYDVTRISKQRFKKYRYVAKRVECSISDYSLADLQNKLPATEFIDFLKDNFENPLDKLFDL